MENENLNDCLCCRGICDCEYGCEHPHNTDTDEFQYCKKWECRKMGLERFGGYCEEHKLSEVKDLK